jgi:DNA-binding response OmpR family regulator
MQDKRQHEEEISVGENTPEESHLHILSDITVGPIRFDASQLSVSVGSKTRRLTVLEGHMLNFLAMHANTVCTFSQIYSHIWGPNNDGDTGLIKVTIRHLRYKIEPDPKNPIYILTVHGVGYILVSHDLDEVL